MESSAVPSKSEISFICPAIARLPPKVIDLIYWKRPIETAIIMSTTFTLLFSLGYLSLISVIAYINLAVLCCTGAARVYYDLITSKRDENASPPFSDWFNKDKESLRKRVLNFVDSKFDCAESNFQQIKHYLLIENYVDSLKFALCMYLLSIIGGFFNLITLLIIVFTVMFTVPRIYDLYHVQIDKLAEKPKQQLYDLLAKVKAQLERIPYFKKQKTI
nr:reticulon 4 [Hymenolepis microstoma]